MPQFDILTLGSQVFGLLITILIFYYYNIKIVIPQFIEIKKLRLKKLKKNIALIASIDEDLTYSVTATELSYKKFLY